MTTLLDHPATVPAAEVTDRNPARFPALTVADRCDAAASKYLQEVTGRFECGSQAFVRVVVTETQHLLFCVHDYRKHAPKIAEDGHEVIDQSASINEKPTDPESSAGF
jgi:hypothetical protein